MARAVHFLKQHMASVRSVAWQAAGSVFCAGASPHPSSSSAAEPSSLAAVASLILDYKVEVCAWTCIRGFNLHVHICKCTDLHTCTYAPLPSA